VPHPAAVIGMSCRFPGASTPEEFWDLLAAGRDAVTPVPPDRWAKGGADGRWGGFLDDVTTFDAAHFGIGDEEARTLDPQARIFLELAHEALERAGYAGPRRRGLRVGVFAAVGDSGYRQLLADARPAGTPPAATALTGNLPNLVAARVAHCLDLDGPALAVDTACSSGLVALHLARRSLADGECDIAVVGGVNLHLTPAAHEALEAARALSPTGRSRAFSTAADGFVPGEGGAALVLRRLAEARRDDDVLAVVRGTAVNNDGTSLSLMAPNPPRQHEVISQAYEACGVDPASVTYVEAHGTGTAVGDPSELRALSRAFPPRPDGGPRLLGSVKTNIGHLLNAAALPSLVKVVLALGRGRLPASLHHTSPSPAVEESGFALVGEVTAWDAPGPRRAGVNSFGFGGTNAHAVLEEAPPSPPPAPAPQGLAGPRLLTLSAGSAAGLGAWTTRLAEHLRDHPEFDEGDVCLTAATARDEAPHRLALVADGDLRERLVAAAAPGGSREPGVFAGVVAHRPRTVFVFPGQGVLGPNIGRELYATAPVYRETLDEASALLGAVKGRELTAWCVGADVSGAVDVEPSALSATEVAQPLLVAHGVALARQLMAWGVRPDALVGHSVGEIAAACVSGALSLSEAVVFAAERGRLMGELTEPGAMLAVRGADEEDIAELVGAAPGELAVAAYNAPGRVVLSGSLGAVRRAAGKLSGQGAVVRPLRVTRAFHSPLMAPAARALTDAAHALGTGACDLPVMSTLTAAWQPRLDGDHLREHALRPVLFGPAVARLTEDGYDTFVELGPGTSLAGSIRAIAAGLRGAGKQRDAAGQRGAEEIGVLVVSAPGEVDRGPTREAARAQAGRGVSVGGAKELLEAVACLWVRGVSLGRAGLDAGHRRVPLPPYPFQRRRHWPAAPGLLHRVTWREAPLDDCGAVGPVLVTGSDIIGVRALAQQLAEQGVEAATAPGAARPRTVILLAGPATHDGANDDEDTAEAVARSQRRSLTAFRQALALLDGSGARRLLVMTEDAHVTGYGSEHPDPAQAIPGALALAVPPETPGTVANWVDLSSADAPGQRLRAVLAEVSAPQAEGAVAWRGGRRLIRAAVTAVPGAAEDADVPDGGERLPAEGAFLITGGGGGIGSALARQLAARGRPVVILAGRSPRPPEGLIEELTALGADARYHPADLAAREDVEHLVAALPPLDAVFHAAGVLRPGSLRATDVPDALDAMTAKTLGTVLLSEALRRHGQRPGVCVAFSSVSSVLPGLAGALGAYAAANAFLDSFAAAERQAGRPWLSVNFGPFAGPGLATAFGTLRATGGRPLPTAPALAALRSACGMDAAQLVLADLTLPQDTASVGPAAAKVAQETAPLKGVQDTTGTPALLRTLLAQSLGVPLSAVDDDTPFLTLGLDSLGAVDLVKRLERQVGRPLPTTLFFEYRTVRELAAHLDAADRPEAAPDTGERAPSSGGPAEGTPFALTPVQRALYTSSRLHPDIPARGHLRLTLGGPLDTDVLGRALTALMERHGMLRMRVDDTGARPMQRVVPAVPLSDWYEVREGAPGSVADAESALCDQPFDLAVRPPVRAVVIREAPDLAHLLLVVHHVAADGYSLNVLAEELWILYAAMWRGGRPVLAGPVPTFASYAAASARPPGSPAPDSDRRYWTERLAARGEPLRLPYDGEPDAPPQGPLARLYGVLDATLTSGLERLAAAHDVSLFHLLLAAYVRCLARWAGRADVAVNVARARRDIRLDGMDRLVGPLADTLPLLCETIADEPITALARRLREEWLESERHARVSSLDLAGLLPGAEGGLRTVSPAGFSFARFPARPAADCPVSVRATGAGTGSATTRLSLLAWADGPVLRLSWNFPSRLFRGETVARLDREYRGELAALCAPGAGRGLVARLLDQFRATPHATAVDQAGKTLTYEALDRASRLLAARLRELGAGPGRLIGLLTEPGPETVIGVVGILRAGAGWVPLDAAHPPARLADQLTRTGATTVVCHASTRHIVDALKGVRALSLDGQSATGSEDRTPPLTPEAKASAESIAYVIFTSGSTGRPKAVPITHRSMENYLDWALTTFGYDAGDRLAQTASPCFDASVRQLLAPLMVGATVVSVERGLLRDPELLLAYMERMRVTVWSSVPTLWEQLLSAAEERVRRGSGRPDLTALRWVHVGGEALPAEHVRRWYDLFDGEDGIPGQRPRIANLYGPTEATINATCHLIDARPADDVQRLPIGRPVAGTDLEVVAPDGTPCGPHESGELLIAGVGLTPGYLGDPELTERAFVVREGRRWYRSGDRVRRGADGVLEFLGRLDDQVKIRGNRVEPGEVEGALQTHPGIARAAVVAREGRLLAFITARPGSAPPDPREARRHVAQALPPYMVPARISLVDALPLNGTGKVDRRALGELADGPAESAERVLQGVATTAARTSKGRTPPATATERRLAAIWAELLEAGPVHREDDFFDLGGDSLLILQVFARLGETSGPLPRPTAIYDHRTLAALASAVDAEGGEGSAEPRGRAGAEGGARPAGEGHVEHAGPFPLTPGQRGFLLAEAIAPGHGSWLARLRLSGPLDPELFQAAVDQLVERHGMLRTVFPSGVRPPVQQELPRSLRLPVVFETVADRGAVDERVSAERERRLEPWAWPLLRLRVLTLDPYEHVLLVHAHHLIGDGYSAALLMRELTAVYGQLAAGHPAELPPPRATFRDHALLTAQAPPGTAPDEAGHRARLEEPYHPPVLRADDGEGEVGGVREVGSGVREAVSFHSARFVLDAGRTAAVRALAAEAGATLYAPLLTAYYHQLQAVTGRADLVVGLAVSGRDRPLPDVDRIFGPFAAAVPVRPSAVPEDFGDALRQLVKEAQAARTHESVVPRRADGLPLTSQFFFTFLDFSALTAANGPAPTASHAPALAVSWDDADSAFAPPSAATDVFMAVRPDGDGLRVTVRGAAEAFTAPGLDGFVHALRDRLARAADSGRAERPQGAAGTRAAHKTRAARGTMDAALVGYLPAPDHLARLAGLPEGALLRAELRGMLFPDGAPRLLETVGTPLGRSGFVCVPLFADELASEQGLVGHTARAVSLASSYGARCVSLAGMIPSLSGYGYDVLRAVEGTAAVTTGHAVTVVSVVRTVQAALDATGQDLADLDVAFVGLGSIGASSLELLLSSAARPPRRLLLCDVRGSAPRLTLLARRLRERGLVGEVEVLESRPGLPDAVYG
ncbi:amino acid adenylation domain-containing protein, partial [Streptomyces sp. BG9H]